MSGTKKTRSKRKVKKIKEMPISARTPDEFWQQHPEVIRRFLQLREDYKQLCAEVEYILRKSIASNLVEISTINSRAKTLNSFLEKLQRKDYDDPFSEIYDFAGVRIVCLYLGDIDKIAEIIRAEFEVVEDLNKVEELGIDKFGYGARHFIVRLGKSSSGARYDDLKQLKCEIQVRTVAQDAWAIIQHHMVYKREAHVPSQLQRKLNSLAGLFETADDQFQRLREQRGAYLTGIKESTSRPTAFLKNELNLDSFKAYLVWAFPGRGLEAWDGQARMVFDGLRAGGYKTLRDVDQLIKTTEKSREDVVKEMSTIRRCSDGTLPANLEPALALSLTAPKWRELIPWGPWAEVIEKHRTDLKRKD